MSKWEKIQIALTHAEMYAGCRLPYERLSDREHALCADVADAKAALQELEEQYNEMAQRLEMQRAATKVLLDGALARKEARRFLAELEAKDE